MLGGSCSSSLGGSLKCLVLIDLEVGNLDVLNLCSVAILLSSISVSGSYGLGKRISSTLGLIS